MRLTIDLRFNPPPIPRQQGEHVVTLLELAALGARPWLLARLLARPWERIRVLRDELPLSGVQAGGEGLAALARGRDVELVRGEHGRSLGRAAFLGRAATDFAVAMPRELLGTARLLRRARTVADTPTRLPAPAGRPERIAYLRTEPSLRYMGLHVGGAATHTSGVVNGFAANGADVHVYAPERPAGIGDVPSTDVPPQRVYQLAQWLTLFEHSDRFVAAAAGRPVDAVYQRYALGSHAGLALARRLDVPLVLEFNGSELWTTRHWGGRGIAFSGVLGALERRNLLDASLVVAVSEVSRDELLAEGVSPERVLLNPNGVDVDALAPLRAGSPAEWRSRLDRPQAPTVGFIGTFGLWHGVRELPAIIAEVHRRSPDTRWHLIGDGPLREQVAGELRARGLEQVVHMPGVVPHEQAIELLAACDVCVSPHVPNPDGTRFFGSPTKLFEYMGLARPIVASDLEQIGEVIEDGRTGLLVEPGMPEAAAAAVARLLDDEGLRARLGEAALASAQASYSWRAHCERIADALEGLGRSTAQPAGRTA